MARQIKLDQIDDNCEEITLPMVTINKSKKFYFAPDTKFPRQQFKQLKETPIRRDIGSHEDMKTYGKNTKWAPASERGDSEYFYNMAIEKFGPVTVFISDDDKIKIACLENGYCYDQTDRMVSREEAAQMLGVESLDVIGD